VLRFKFVNDTFDYIIEFIKHTYVYVFNT